MMGGAWHWTWINSTKISRRHVTTTLIILWSRAR
jgi:hypothetical protein